MTPRTDAANRIKTELLAELALIRPPFLSTYWEKYSLSKPDLLEFPKVNRVLGKPLELFEEKFRAKASAQPDPFGWMLAQIDLKKWGELCDRIRAPWMVRLWLATASQLRAEMRLVHKAHGWRDTVRLVASNPQNRAAADKLFFALLRNANPTERETWRTDPELQERLALARAEKDEAFLRNFRRACKAEPMLPDLPSLALYLVRHWLMLPRGFPGLCFFSDEALHTFLVAFGQTTDPRRSRGYTPEFETTKQVRERFGLVQAGAQAHLIEKVSISGGCVSFLSKYLTEPLHFRGIAKWRGRQVTPG